MPEAAALIRSWTVGKRTVTLTAPHPQPGKPVCIAMEWEPEPPRRLSSAEWSEYRTGRDAALKELCEELGLRGLVVEL